MPSSLLVRVVFGMLVLATVGAFFVTQRLKRSTPIVERVFFHAYVSPNGDGRKDSVSMRFDLPRRNRVSVGVVSVSGDQVRSLVGDRRLGRGTHSFVWDGREDNGSVAPDGGYRLRVTLRDEGRSVIAPRMLTLDTTPPRPRILAVTPPNIVPGDRSRRGRARIRYSGASDPAPRFSVYRTDGGQTREVASFAGPRFRQIAEWDGHVKGRPAPDGVYSIAVTVQDRAGNAGSSPAHLPPRRGEAAPRSGVSVRYLSLRAPLVPVQDGRVAVLQVGPKPRRLRWNLSRVGPGQPLSRGGGGGPRLGIRVPSRAHSGLYVVRVQAGGHHAVAPLVVRARGGGSRPLVVLPAISWQGENQVDDDRDGFPDTLDQSPSVQDARPFAHGLLPAGFERQEQRMVRFLDRSRFSYDITTDLALARGEGPRIGGRTGLFFAGTERWLTERLDVALRDYVDRGGRVASFGTDAFRRRVSVGPTALSDPSPMEPANVFGEETAQTSIEPAPMVVNTNRIALFSGTDGFIGLFSRFEQSRTLTRGATLVAAAGRDSDHPAFVAYRLGSGLVIRAGSPDWAAQLSASPELGNVTRRVWALLSR